MSTKSPKKEKEKADGHLTRTKAVQLNTRTLRRKEGSFKKISEMTQMLLTPIHELTPKVKTKRSPKEKPAEKRDLDKAKKTKQAELGEGQGVREGQGEGQGAGKRKRGRKRKADTQAESPEKPESPKKSAPPQPVKTLPPKTPPDPPPERELSMYELIQIADEHSLDEEDFMEILTCDSPVWWEDPPNEAYSEDPIFPKSLYADHYEEVMRCNSTPSASITLPHTKHIDYKFMKKRCKLEHLLGNIKNKKNNNDEHNEKQHKNNHIEQKNNNNSKQIEQDNKNNKKETQNKNSVNRESKKSLIEVKSLEICNEESINTSESKEKRLREESNDEIIIKDGTAEPEAKRLKKCSESTEDDSIVGFNNEDLLRDLENMDIPIESENESEEIAKTVQLKEINSDDVSCSSQDNMETDTVINKNIENNVLESNKHCNTTEPIVTEIREKNLKSNEEMPCTSQESTPDVISMTSTTTCDTVSDIILSSSPTNVLESDTQDNVSQNSADYTNSQKSDGEILESQRDIGGIQNSNSENSQDDNTTKKLDECSNKGDKIKKCSNRSDIESKSITKNASDTEDKTKDSTKEVKTKKLDTKQLMAVYKTLIGFGEVNNMDKKKTESDNTKAVVVTDKNVENVTTFYKKCKNTKRPVKNDISDKETQNYNENIQVQETSQGNFNTKESEQPNSNKMEIIGQSTDDKLLNEQIIGDIDMTEQNVDHTEVIENVDAPEILQQNNLDIVEQNINDTVISEQNVDETEVTEENIGKTVIIEQSSDKIEIIEQNIDHTEILEQNIDVTVINNQNIDHTETVQQTTDHKELSSDDTEIYEPNIIETSINENNVIVIEEGIIIDNVIEEQIIDSNQIEEQIIDNNVIEEEISDNQIEEEIIDSNQIEEQIIKSNDIGEEIIDHSQTEKQIIDSNQIEEEMINVSQIEEQIMDDSIIEEEIIENNDSEEQIINDDEIEEENIKNQEIVNSNNKETKNESDNVKNKCNCNNSGGRSVHYSIIPDGKSAKYCLKCSSIFETETCCYCEKKLQSETPCASCKNVI